ncbi:nucleoside-diphosphate kinase [Candidatus Dojkabacteria bacterium]|uniref:nucleoside-diphosphate kinase n=1 Tax=Candidatus Dojkabacteria bacterium TaxID=2099670 RepID=A0A955IDF6_9BACT|nr:nucleoside-diphosphate kinase [Candidatus Dojkabacteria bacterium]
MSYKTNSHERSLVLIKPDGVQRGLIGEVISRFEKKGLKITAMKLAWPTKELAAKHYDQPHEAMMLLGTRTLQAYEEKGVKHHISDPIEIAKDIQKKLVKFLVTGPVVAMVIEGAHAIQHVRKMRGHTNPLAADVGTITADLTIDSYFIADDAERAIRNLVHASGSVDEAENEIKIWFKESEICDYDLAIEKILYSKEWEEERADMVKGK